MKKLCIYLVCCVFPGMVLAGPVNINTADATELSRELTGVGMSKARAIVEYREANGPFAAPEEILKVKGIGERVLSDNPHDIITAD